MKELGDLDGARGMYERALKIDEATYGPDHPKVAIRSNNLGRVMQGQGDLSGARIMHERALKIDETTFGLTRSTGKPMMFSAVNGRPPIA